MRKSSLALLLTLLIAGAAHADRGGVEVGNGGNVVQCNGNDYFASLDYVTARYQIGRDYVLSDHLWASDSLQRIGAIIDAKLPAWSNSFKEFVSEIETNEPFKHYTWISDRNLEEVDQDVPELAIVNYCMNGFGGAYITQVVVRTVRPTAQGEQIILRYDSDVFHSLLPKQRSFLVVHEWLWNVTSDITTNRNVDWLMHSEWFEKASSAEVIQKFKEFGLSYP